MKHLDEIASKIVQGHQQATREIDDVSKDNDNCNDVSSNSDRTENHSYESELDEDDILAAKKKLNFHEDS